MPTRRQRPALRGAWLLLLLVIAMLVIPAATASSATAAGQPRLSVANGTAETLHLLFAESGTVHCRTVDHGPRACDDPQDLAALVSPWEVQPGQTIEVRYLSGGEPSPRDSVLNVRYAIGLGGDQAQLALHASGGSVSCRVLASKAYTCREVGDVSGTVRFSLEPVG